MWTQRLLQLPLDLTDCTLQFLLRAHVAHGPACVKMAPSVVPRASIYEYLYRREPFHASPHLTMSATDTHPSVLLDCLRLTLTEAPPLCNGILKLSSAGDLELYYGRESPRSAYITVQAIPVLTKPILSCTGSLTSRMQFSIKMP